jgi:uncharacterized protein YkwD
VDGTVRVSWGGVRVPRGSLTVVELERGASPDATTPLTTVPPRPRKHYDTPPAPGVYWYRARALVDTAVGAWSGAVPAEIAPVATPVPAPTPVTGAGDPPLAPGQRECRDGAVAETLALVNQARDDAGASPLREDPRLRWAARARVIDMARTQQLSHDGWTQTVAASGYPIRSAAENIANGYFSPLAVVQGWLGSSGHRANMLSNAYRDTGVGCVIDQNGKLWWAEEFAS